MTTGVKSVGTQCDLLAAPPLTLMSHADTTTEVSLKMVMSMTPFTFLKLKPQQSEY